MSKRLTAATQWITPDQQQWRANRDLVLCDEGPDPCAVAMLAAGQPDSFTVAERLNAPAPWLAEHERDGDKWLRALVRRRLQQWPQLARDSEARSLATVHVHDQFRRVLEWPTVSGQPVADVLWNQEAPYVIDRVAAWCLLGHPAAVVDQAPAVIEQSHVVATGLLDWFADRQRDFDLAAMMRFASAAGLLDLDIKGGRSACPPIDTGLLRRSGGRPDSLAAELVRAARRPMVVDDVLSLLMAVGQGSARLVWFTDDLIETAFDLLVIQRLIRLNRRLTVTIAPRSRFTDNDATYDDVVRLLRHPALSKLANACHAARVHVNPHGPALAAPVLPKLAPAMLRDLHEANGVVVKGGRNHELMIGTLDRPMWTGYVVTREFTESQAGYDARSGPLIFAHSPPGGRPWWGWRGRAERALAVAEDRTISACWSTIADHRRRMTSTNPAELAGDLTELARSWPRLHTDYARSAGSEIRTLADRLTNISRLPAHHHLARRARQLITHSGDHSS